jgi:Tfp pilus assembly protein PilO
LRVNKNMKLKILIFPLIIVALLYLLIWVIVPQYGDIAATQKKLDDAKVKLAGVVEKENNAASLVQDLNNNSAEQNILVKYLPENKQYEDVVASVNTISGTSGVSIVSMKVDEAKPASSTQTVYDKSGNVVPKTEDPVKSFIAEIAVKGDYGKIRPFIFSLDTIDRLNEMTALKIEGSNNTNEPGILTATLRVKFDYFEKAEKITEIRDEFFAKGKFDMSVASDIRKKATMEIPKLDIGEFGRENLFTL